MKKFKYIILGAGPTGLTLAHSLIDRGIARDQILLLEKEATVGGLCRSSEVDGKPLDIGGGHFLDVRKKDVLDFLFRFLPKEEWTLFDRVSKIRLRGQEVDHPLEGNLWQLPKEDQVDFLESIAAAGCIRSEPMPESFADWIQWKLGSLIAKEYMLPYNRKIWSMDPNELGTYWLHKLPNVSFRETLQSCLEGNAYGALLAHGTFYYPKEYGYGEVWLRIGKSLGDVVVTNCKIQNIDLKNMTINNQWAADTIINTIPWHAWNDICAMPENVKTDIRSLKNVSIDVDYIPEKLDTKSHWTYDPDEKKSFHRLLLRFNFCAGSKGYWTETNSKRALPAVNFRHRNEYAYPVNTKNKPETIERINQWAAQNGVIGAGRWGKWDHMNSDIAVSEALSLAHKLTT